jgi:hypothetical protein
MALGGVYETGTITIAAGGHNVTGVGTLWGPVAEVGDWILCNGQVGMVGAVADDTHLTLESAWQGTLPTAAAYVLIKMSWLRYDPALTQAKLRELLAALDDQGTFLFVDTAPPDPALGQDGQWALQTNTSPWRLWYKTGGVWVEQAAPAGLKWRGSWVTATAYVPADAIESGGSSYVCILSHTSGAGNVPPNATYWNLMAAKGSTGSTGSTGPQGMVWRGNWSSSTNYAINDGVAMGDGSSYIAIATSGPGFGGAVAPPNATKWNVLAQGGTTAIADSQIDPIKLNADNPAETLLFHNRLGTVAYDNAQTLTDDTLPTTIGQKSRARINIYAAPFDAMAFNGMQINGSMDLSQEKGTAGTAVSGSTQYVCDGWSTVKSGTMAATAFQQALNLFPGTSKILAASIGTAQASIGAGDFLFIWQPIEGYRIARLWWGISNPVPITISFWSAHHRTGLYSVAVRNSPTASAPDRSYVATYTQANADTPQYNTITVPGDTAGTWANDFNVGMLISFAMASGSTFITAPNVWTAGNFLAATGQINGVAATTDAFRISGLIVLPGLEAPSSVRAPYIVRPYGQELLLAKRYWQKCVAESGAFYSTSAAWILAKHYGMRVTPILLASAPLTLTDVGSGNYTQSAASVSGTASNTQDASIITMPNFTGGTAYRPCGLYQGGGFIGLDARM